jgi:hypothetical protein
MKLADLKEAKYYNPSYAARVQERVDLEYNEWILPNKNWTDVHKMFGHGEWNVSTKDHERVINEMTEMFGDPEHTEDIGPASTREGSYQWEVSPLSQRHGQKLIWDVEYFYRADTKSGTLSVGDVISGL